MVVQRRVTSQSRWGALSIAALAAAVAQIGYGEALAKGGTAKPPPPPPPTATCATGQVPCVTILPPAGPALLPIAPTVNGFSIIGPIQSVTGPACPPPGSPPNTAGGTVTVNGVVITIPSDTIVQYPANTLTWADAICGINPIATDGTGGTAPALYPGVEIRVDGNIVNSPSAIADLTMSAPSAVPI